MNRVSMLREQLREAHQFLEGTLEGVTPDQAHWTPAGTALPIGAHYGHIVILEDFAIGGILSGAKPLFASRRAGKTGFSALPPLPDPASPGIPNFSSWARTVKVDLPAAREYAREVYEATDRYLAGLDDAAFERDLDLSAVGVGHRTVGWFLSNPVLGNVNMHCGEISCLKGLQGAKGYPA